MLEAAAILVVEDDVNLLSLLCELLEEEGHSVVSASSGEEALQHAARVPFDLIVVDVRMGGMDGLEALARMKRQLPGVASMVITGYASDEDAIRATRLGVGEYLRKPFRDRHFLEAVSRVLRDSSQIRAAIREVEALRRLFCEVLDAVSERMRHHPGIAEAGRRARRIAVDQGVEASTATVSELATLLEGARRAGVSLPSLPHSVADVLEQLEERWDGSGPRGLKGENLTLPARIAALALAATPGETAAQLVSRHPGHFDPLLLESLERCREDPDLSPLQRRSLLALGQALLRSGDPEARSALERVAQHRKSREGVLASLALARLEQSEGRPESCRRLILDSLDRARAIGPAAASMAALEGGLLLLEVDSRTSAALLQEAVSGLERRRLLPEQAAARLALGRAQGAWNETAERALEAVLSDPLASDIASGWCGWALEWFVQAPHNRVLRDAVARGMAESPATVASLLQGLPGASRFALLESGLPLPEPVARVLAGESDPVFG
ncbi:MAG: response regulator, partial [Candidatus Eremiobacterota bacterium]